MYDVLIGPTEFFVDVLTSAARNRQSPYASQADHHVKAWTWELEIRRRSYSSHVMDYHMSRALKELLDERNIHS